jgi:hypothetical protein
MIKYMIIILIIVIILTFKGEIRVLWIVIDLLLREKLIMVVL